MITVEHIHPMLVHFPIALLMVGFLAEVSTFFVKDELWLSKASLYLLILGSLTSIVAYLSGDFFTKELSGAIGEVRENHEFFAGLSMWTALATTALKVLLIQLKKENTSLKWVGFSLYLLSVVFIGITGYLGGILVYNYMIPR